ncbi:MAG TPA: SRPBCC family protein [Roseiflexaceae bacterium]|nr:SRPBCC family protein [Roseiflexaceae bacterium]
MNTPDRFLCMTRRFEAAPERVFDAWLSPEVARKWLFTSPFDEAYHAELDARVGGRWTITARRGGMDYTALGEYLEIDRPRRLVFTFTMPQFSPNSDRLTIEIVPDGAGCILTLTQAGVDIANELRLLPPGIQGGTEKGWIEMFDILAAALG